MAGGSTGGTGAGFVATTAASTGLAEPRTRMKNSGTKKIARIVADNMPPITPVPIVAAILKF